MGSQGPTRASCAGTTSPTTSRTAPDPRAPGLSTSSASCTALSRPPSSLVDDGGNKGRGAAVTRSKPPGHLAPARLHWVAASFVTHHLPTWWEQERVTQSCSPVVVVNGRKDYVPVRDCVRARCLDWRPCVGGQGIRAPPRPGSTPGGAPGLHHSANTASMRADDTNSAMDLES